GKFPDFISLLDNYKTSTGVAEVVTPEEIVENNCFLDAILATEVMKLAHGYLLKKNLAKPNLADFKYQLYDIWFQLYARKEGDSKKENPTNPDKQEFEFALYIVLFLLAEERVTRETVKIEEYELQMVVCCHGHHIGTAYPVLLSISSEDQ
ncbi:poly(U)-specific endoribonuclease-like, partial [Opisthocomus hoazin]|uniref:poly(U)-specific endoribonuclease-like n=1 Tax=Opisthocomus hoazin TaxID=30419 RepID=UPI003F537006